MGDQSNMSGPGSVADVSARLRTATFVELPELLSRYRDDPRTGVRGAVAAARRRCEHFDEVAHATRDKYDLMHEMGGTGLVVGVDEVGRGAVAGPLTVGAVVLPDEPLVMGLDDSKRLTPARREALSREIRGVAIAVGIAHIPPEDIDRDGMAASLRRAMQLAIADTGVSPDAVLIDGNPIHAHPKERCIVKGDARIACIAAASIVAKVTRDQLMVLSDSDYPGYGFVASKGYASPRHIAAIRERGLTDFHRASFCRGFLDVQDSLF